MPPFELWIRTLLGLDSWRIWYRKPYGWIFPGHVTMSREDAENWAQGRHNCIAIEKTAGPGKRILEKDGNGGWRIILS